MNNPPHRICIGHDDYYARLVGRTRDGKQFFVTQPFVPYGHDFVARYLFDEEWSVIAEPGNYMAFYLPWDGEYDT